MDKDENKLGKYVVIANTIRIIAWILLAIYFQKWWISLFSAFFLLTITDDGGE